MIVAVNSDELYYVKQMSASFLAFCIRVLWKYIVIKWHLNKPRTITAIFVCSQDSQ